ncbi:acylglycerol kinase, mitochondrial-like [Uloborus diversus]|uniref:acylglycerol kinase, mitochondrial-like n=1 Tax=Uloborus diversus TaxID=327109 RepID=UPI00240A3857|nr:acylglycerol kinase, mitochondrial-like [Uloborus diversus]
MNKLVNFAKLVRRNWKKSAFLFGLCAYGGSYANERYQTFQLMRAYCEEARIFGEKTLPQYSKPKHVTVILNPEANNKKAKIQFEKFVSPLLNLAGFKVSVIQTEKEKQARDLMEIMSNTDAVLVAGGDGTFQEAVTGLMSRPNIENECIPIGVIPLGKTNTLANHLFGSKSSSSAQLMAESAMAVVRDMTTRMDVMKIQYMDEKKSVYAMCNFEEGVFADVEPSVQKYWYLGVLKDKYVYLKNSFKEHKPVQNLNLQYVAPCSGCSKCFKPPKANKTSGRWWSVFVPQKSDIKENSSSPDLSKVINEECGKYIDLNLSCLNVSVFTLAVNQGREATGGPLFLKMYPETLSMKEFIISGLKHRKEKLIDSTGISTIIPARELRIEKNSNVKDEDETNVDVKDGNQTVADVMDGNEIVGDIKDINVTQTSGDVKDGNEIVGDVKEEDTMFSYIDNEKYPRASCTISVMPKQILMYG